MITEIIEKTVYSINDTWYFEQDVDLLQQQFHELFNEILDNMYNKDYNDYNIDINIIHIDHDYKIINKNKVKQVLFQVILNYKYVTSYKTKIKTHIIV